MRKIILLYSIASLSYFFPCQSQNTTPTVVNDKSLIPQSPDAVADNMINSQVSLYSGSPAVSIPIYDVKCGALSLPVSISYNYNGLQTAMDAGWVGFGWDLNAGGVIRRQIQGAVDNSKNAGYNYGDYSIKDSVTQANNTAFFTNVYANNSSTSYDVAPDIYDCNFNGYYGKFYWYKSKAYLLSFNKKLKVSWPGSTGPITITTDDGTSYLFGQMDIAIVSFSSNHTQKNYVADWRLTSVISADKKDTILLSYTTYLWKPPFTRVTSYFVGGTFDDDGILYNDTLSPVINVPVLTSIRCRTSSINFLADAATRTDLAFGGPKLREIDVKDSISGNIVQKNIFSYEYFNQTASNPSWYERLKLKSFSRQNPLNASDSLFYRFAYINEYGTNYPQKGTTITDQWGFYNGAVTTGLFTTPFNLYRYPSYSYASYGALDTLYYPTGAFTVYNYELNDYDSSASQHHASGAGIRIKNIGQYNAGTTVPALVKYYSYLKDDGTSSSGSVNHVANVSGNMYIKDTLNFNAYVMNSNNPGSAISDNIFFYGKVTELASSNKEKHKTDYYFRSFSNLITDVDMYKKMDYRYDSVSATYKPLLTVINNYDTTGDTTFLAVTAYIDSSYTVTWDPGTLRFKYGYAYTYNNTYWKHLHDQRVTQFDNLNDSLFSVTNYNYNAQRNLDSSRQTLPDGRGVIIKFKYPDDYASAVTGNMVTNNVIGPLIEKQTWMQTPGSAPQMVDGKITSYDQTIFRPVSDYTFDASSPVGSLSSETIVSGKYTSLLSDANYELRAQYTYDGNSNLIRVNKSTGMNISYIYDYRHSLPVAEIKNAAASQFAYTSFESDNNGNWSVPDTIRNRSVKMTGNQSYTLSGKTISTTTVSGRSYIVSYWSTNGNITVSANGVSVAPGPIGPIKNGMVYYEHVLPNTTTSVSVTATSATIDDLRLYPADGEMSTITYAPLIGKTSESSANSTIHYYEYDGYNRVKVIRDINQNVVKMYDYEFLQGNSFYNVAKSQGFVKNNCACGQQGSGTVTYTVAANTYLSHAGQFDADQMALNDIAANGQNYANTNGSCVAILCSGVDKKIVNCTTCQTGNKIYTSSVWQPAQHMYLCTYHYEWTDGTRSQDFTEFSKAPCPVLN